MATDINFDRLERELSHALEADKRYWEKNDAKFRAVNQRVASYEEFKEIVNASHLKPLSKGERVTDMRSKESGVWNRGATGGGVGLPDSPAAAKSTPTTTTTADSQTPASCQQFLRHWRTLKTPEAQFAHLVSLSPVTYSAIFAADVPFGLLGQFVCAFDACLTVGQEEAVVGILAALARCQRFRLAVEFFSPAEREAAARLMQRLAESGLDTAGSDLAQLRALYVRL